MIIVKKGDKNVTKLSPIQKHRRKSNKSPVNFSTHGLNRAAAESKFEAYFWRLMVFLGITLSAYLIHGRISKYFLHDVYTKVSLVVTDINSFPAITICNYDLLRKMYFTYCGSNILDKHYNDENFCSNFSKNYSHAHNAINSYNWSNGIFKVLGCKTASNMYCANSSFLKSLRRYNHSCFTLNYNNNLHDVSGEVQLHFKLTKPNNSSIIAILHDPDILEIDLTKQVKLDLGKIYDISTEKTIIKRLPYPFPSNCSNEKGNDLFPGKYSRHTCIESYIFTDMYKQCGDVIDYVRPFIPYGIRKTFSKRKRIKEMKHCLQQYSTKEIKDALYCHFPCESLELSIIPSFTDNMIYPDTYTVNIHFHQIDIIRMIEEKELYSWYQMTSQVGGFVGLIIGASLMSLVEIIAYLTIRLYKLCFR